MEHDMQKRMRVMRRAILLLQCKPGLGLKGISIIRHDNKFAIRQKETKNDTDNDPAKHDGFQVRSPLKQTRNKIPFFATAT